MPLFQSESKCETILDLHENETACRTHFHMKGFALRLVLKQRHKRTRKWSISSYPGEKCPTCPKNAFFSKSPVASGLVALSNDSDFSHIMQFSFSGAKCLNSALK